MRIRKVNLEWEGSSINLDFRGASGYVEDVVGIYGRNLSGKTLVQHLIITMWLTGLGIVKSSEGSWILDKLKSDGFVEFDNDGEITVGIMKSGKIVQKPVVRMLQRATEVDGGILSYFSDRRIDDWGGRAIVPIITDMSGGGVRNSVIIIDDFDLGLDCFSAREFLGWLLRKSLERNNQLIVMSRSDGLYGSIGEERVRRLGGGGDLVADVIGKMK